MKTAEEILNEWRHTGDDLEIIGAMKEYANQALKIASHTAKVKAVDYGCFGIPAYEYEIDKESITNTPLL